MKTQNPHVFCVSEYVDPTFAPATGTPEVGGFTSWESQYLIRGLQGIQFVAFDLVEVSPPYDNEGATTCLLAANLVYEFISLPGIGRVSALTQRFERHVSKHFAVSQIGGQLVPPYYDLFHEFALSLC